LKRLPAFALALCAAALSPSCITSIPPQSTDAGYELTLSFAKGAAPTGNIIYVAWIQDSSKSFVRYIYTCARLLNNSEKPNIPAKDTCPFWRIGLYDTTIDDAVDVVSGATKTSTDFNESITIPAGSPSRFTVYFEYDRSFDGNDWWTDQPAIVYSADVELDGSATKSFALTARGWSRNAGGGSGGNMNNIDSDFPNATDVGELVTEMRYITNHAELGSELFGAAYAAGSSEDATNMVGALTLTATKK
jgi:hypothetical protein